MHRLLIAQATQLEAVLARLREARTTCDADRSPQGRRLDGAGRAARTWCGVVSVAEQDDGTVVLSTTRMDLRLGTSPDPRARPRVDRAVPWGVSWLLALGAWTALAWLLTSA